MPVTMHSRFPKKGMKLEGKHKKSYYNDRSEIVVQIPHG